MELVSRDNYRHTNIYQNIVYARSWLLASNLHFYFLKNWIIYSGSSWVNKSDLSPIFHDFFFRRFLFERRFLSRKSSKKQKIDASKRIRFRDKYSDKLLFKKLTWPHCDRMENKCHRLHVQICIQSEFCILIWQYDKDRNANQMRIEWHELIVYMDIFSRELWSQFQCWKCVFA